MKLFASIFLSLAAISSCQFSQAAPITYQVNRFLPAQFLGDQAAFVTGFITTNGKLGSINVGDITAYDLAVDRTPYTTHVTNLNSSISLVGRLTASSSNLIFSLNSPSSTFGLNYIEFGSLIQGWALVLDPSVSTLNDNAATYTLLPAPFNYPRIDTTSALYYGARQVEIANVAGTQTQGGYVATVPVPQSVMLLALGMALIGTVRRRAK
jgi:hypothetical protein